MRKGAARCGRTAGPGLAGCGPPDRSLPRPGGGGRLPPVLPRALSEPPPRQAGSGALSAPFVFECAAISVTFPTRLCALHLHFTEPLPPQQVLSFACSRKTQSVKPGRTGRRGREKKGVSHGHGARGFAAWGSKMTSASRDGALGWLQAQGRRGEQGSHSEERTPHERQVRRPWWD